MKNNITITEIQRFCMHDGPGIRTTVFFKGCPLKCKWCHNPENIINAHSLLFSEDKCVFCGACEAVCEYGVHRISEKHFIDRNKCSGCLKCAEACPVNALEMSEAEMSAEEIIGEVLEDKVFYGDLGGMTVSGGEPTVQFDGLISLLKLAKENDVSTCVETCGMFDSSEIDSLCKYTDTVLFDIKDTEPSRLKENTGADYSLILRNLKAIDSENVPVIIRAIMIPEINMNENHYSSLTDIYKSLNNVRYVELLPYHPYGISKAQRLGMNQVQFTKPTEVSLESAVRYFIDNGVNVKLSGTVVS